MKLKLTHGDQRRAILAIDDSESQMVVVRCPDAVLVAKEIRDAVNRAYLFDGMVAVLRNFHSTEMGNSLIDSAHDSTTKTEMTKLIKAVDIVLKGVEIYQERGKQ